MDPITIVIDKFKSFAKSSTQFVNGAIRKCPIYSNHDPIEILKHLQREAFSDIMKLRDRQDKTERVLSLYKTIKMGPFQEATTHINGVIDLVGAFLFVENDNHLACDTLEGAGIRTGVDLRFIFKTAIRQKDMLVAEFVACQNSLVNHDAFQGSPLTLEKLMYLANMNDWLSVIISPFGAQCNEFGVASNFDQGRHVGKVSSFVPPLFNQQYNCGAGVTFKGSNFATSLAELIPANKSLNTFGRVTFQPFEETRLTLSCLWKIPHEHSYFLKFGTLAIPTGRVKQKGSGLKEQASSSSSSSGSFAVMLDTELDESSNVSGWIELQKASKLLQWGASLSDIPENELGWGLRMGGKNEANFNLLQFEGFLNFSFGKKFNLQPGLVYATDGKNHTPALVFRTTWLM